MRRGWLGFNRKRGAIVLEVFRQVGLGVGELQNFELVGGGEKYRWLDDGVDLYLRYLVHCFQFANVSLEVRRVGRSCG